MRQIVRLVWNTKQGERATVCGSSEELSEAIEKLVGDFEENAGVLHRQIIVTVAQISDWEYEQVVRDENYA